VKRRVLSGIQPSGTPTLGNYVGAIKRWARDQSQSESFFPIVNLHAITIRQDPAELANNTLDTAAWLLAVGIDPSQSVLFVQSQVAAHSQLGWILNNYATYGELGRMTQFKDKSQKLGPEGQLAGLFDYPVLMAADVLLYDIDEVPVGEDQKQHVELMRDIATRFNNLYGPVFKVPTPTMEEGARIMNLQRPDQKMSKSDKDDAGVVYLSDSPDVVRQKISRAVTDSGSTIEASADKPAVTNLLTIFAAISDKTIAALEADYAGKGYGAFKSDLAELVAVELSNLQAKFSVISADRDKLLATLDDGRDRAAAIADDKLAQVKAKIGLL